MYPPHITQPTVKKCVRGFESKGLKFLTYSQRLPKTQSPGWEFPITCALNPADDRNP